MVCKSPVNFTHTAVKHVRDLLLQKDKRTYYSCLYSSALICMDKSLKATEEANSNGDYSSSSDLGK